MTARDAVDPRDALRDALAALPDLANAIGQDAAQREARRELPFEGFAIFRRSALGVLRIPVERGGLGGTLVDLFDTIATLAAADSNLAHALRIHYDQIETLRLSPRTPFNDVQLERALAGAIFGGASTERGTSRPGENTTVLRRDGDHYRVTGRKYYSTGTAFADFARINVENEQGDAVAVIIPVARDGVQVLDDWDGMGQRMTASGSLLLNDVQVFADEVAARDGSTLVGRHCGALRQLHLVATGAGIVRNVVADARRCSRTAARCCSPAPTARDDHFIQQVVGELSAHSHAIDGRARKRAGARPFRRRDRSRRCRCTCAGARQRARDGTHAAHRQQAGAACGGAAVRSRWRVGDGARTQPRPALAQPAHDLQPQPVAAQGARDRRLRAERRDDTPDRRSRA